MMDEYVTFCKKNSGLSIMCPWCKKIKISIGVLRKKYSIGFAESGLLGGVVLMGLAQRRLPWVLPVKLVAA
jgi:hypothetical protein